jgi:KipI family sensor histidine kinase inhibitor
MAKNITSVSNLNVVLKAEGVKFSPLGAKAWLVESLNDFNLEAQRKIWFMSESILVNDCVESVIPGVTNLLVIFKQITTDVDFRVQLLLKYWQQAQEVSPDSKTIEIPVCYGGEHAIDLERICTHSGLSEKEVIKRHYSGNYTVMCVASAPGFGYLHGLDPLLATPRKTVPSLNMIKGSVTIGGIQTGVAVLTGPNGWNSIGYADLDMFDSSSSSPSLMGPGDVIKFVPERIEL